MFRIFSYSLLLATLTYATTPVDMPYYPVNNRVPPPPQPARVLIATPTFRPLLLEIANVTAISTSSPTSGAAELIPSVAALFAFAWNVIA
jgi:hypothetical protein